MGYYGKLVRVRDLAKRTIPPIQTMRTQSSRSQSVMRSVRKPSNIAVTGLNHRLTVASGYSKTAIMGADVACPGLRRVSKMITPLRSGNFSTQLQQFGHPFEDKPLITMIGMKEAEDRPASMSAEQLAHFA